MIRHSRFVISLFAGVALYCGGSFSSRALDARVTVGPGGGNSFSPATTNITAGDRVIWVWQSIGHSSTSDNLLWDSGTHNNPFSFTNQFNTPGNYPYHCTPHLAFNMRGTIAVAAPPSPPTTTITNPLNGIVLSAPASFLLAASASDPGGSVTNVQFLQGTSVLGNDTTGPYSINVNGVVAGSHQFSAVASDNSGLKATNTITVQVVTPVPIMLGSAERLSATSFRFGYSANTGLRYVVERSADLIDWIPLNTNTAAGSPVTFTDDGATGSPGYYRVGRLPNP